MVCGDYKPRGVPFGGGRDEIVVGLFVLGPEKTLLEVGEGELPVFARVVDARLEAVLLFFLRDVKKKLQDDDVVVVEHGLEFVDVFEAAPDFFWGDDLVDAGGEDVFVVGAVEDLDHAAWRDLGVDAPEEVVAGFE